MRMLRETESRVDFFKRGAGRNVNEREKELKDNKMNIQPQNKLINNVKNRFKQRIDAILNRYDSIVYYHKYKRFYKGHYGILELIKDKVNLAIACLSKYISKYMVNSNTDGHPHRLFIDILGKGQLRRDKGNSKK